MDRAEEEILKMYESRNRHCVSEKVAQLLDLHIQEVKKAYEHGYWDGKNATFMQLNNRLD